MATAYRDLVIQAAPQLYWRLDDTSGTSAVDSSGNGNTGTYSGTFSLNQPGLLASDADAAALFGNAALSNGRVVGGANTYFNPGNAITLEAWAKWTVSPFTGGALFGSQGAQVRTYLRLGNLATGQLDQVAFTPDRLGGNPACTWSNAVPTDGLGHHYVLTFSDATDTAELFIDGVSAGTRSCAVPFAADASTFRAGYDEVSAGFMGVIDEVAVYTYVLSPATILAHYQAGSTGPIAIQTPVPIPKPALAMTVKLADGRVLRFGPDEFDVDQTLTTASFDTELPGGFGPADVTVPRSNRFDPLDVPLFASTRIYDARTNRTLHLGRVVATPEPAPGQVEFQIEGWSKHLEDDNSARTIFYDRDLTHWTPPSVQRRLNISAAAIGMEDPVVATDTATGSPAVETMIDGAFGQIMVSEAWYSPQGMAISALDYAWKKSSTLPSSGSNWIWRTILSDDDTLGLTSDVGASLQAAGPGSGTASSTTTSRKAAVVQLRAGAAGGTQSVHYAVDWTLLGVIGGHNLTIQGAVSAPNTGRGLLVSDMAAYVLTRWAPLLEFTTGAQGSIEPTSFVVPHSVFLDDTTARDMLDSLVLLGGNSNLPMDWGVYDGADGLPEFFLKTPGNYGKTWRARRDQAVESQDSGADSSDRLNGVKVSYDDGSGTKRTVGPVGSGADTETATLQDSDPTNPANQDGARHWHLFDAGITSLAGATLIGQIILANANTILWRGTVNLKGTVLDDSGNSYPVARVRAGDQVVVEDDWDTRPRRIVNTTYDGDTDSTSCSVGGEPNRLDVLLSKLGVVLEGQVG